MSSLIKAGVKVRDRLILSDRAHLLMPYHRLLDGASETRKGTGKIGTTNRGIGPAYMDKMARVGLKVVDLFEPGYFRQKVREVVKEKNFWLKNYYNQPGVDADKIGGFLFENRAKNQTPGQPTQPPIWKAGSSWVKISLPRGPKGPSWTWILEPILMSPPPVPA